LAPDPEPKPIREVALFLRFSAVGAVGFAVDNGGVRRPVFTSKGK
jgi:hypothetical protein